MATFEPNESELAKMKAHTETINNLQQEMQQIQKQIIKHNAKRQELEEQMSERLDLPDVPLSQWDFTNVDWVELAGEVEIPENEDG